MNTLNEMTTKTHVSQLAKLSIITPMTKVKKNNNKDNNKDDPYDDLDSDDENEDRYRTNEHCDLQLSCAGRSHSHSHSVDNNNTNHGCLFFLSILNNSNISLMGVLNGRIYMVIVDKNYDCQQQRQFKEQQEHLYTGNFG